MNHIEEINIVHAGGNYGWMKREGYFENGMSRPGGALNQLFALPADVMDGRRKDEFTYPVAMYDHNEGQAVSGGFAYYGRIAALRNKFVFGDIVRGRLFASDLAARRRLSPSRETVQRPPPPPLPTTAARPLPSPRFLPGSSPSATGCPRPVRLFPTRRRRCEVRSDGSAGGARSPRPGATPRSPPPRGVAPRSLPPFRAVTNTPLVF